MRNVLANYLKIGSGVVFGLLLADRHATLGAALTVSLAVSFLILDRD